VHALLAKEDAMIGHIRVNLTVHPSLPYPIIAHNREC